MLLADDATSAASPRASTRELPNATEHRGPYGPSEAAAPNVVAGKESRLFTRALGRHGQHIQSSTGYPRSWWCWWIWIWVLIASSRNFQGEIAMGMGTEWTPSDYFAMHPDFVFSLCGVSHARACPPPLIVAILVATKTKIESRKQKKVDKQKSNIYKHGIL